MSIWPVNATLIRNAWYAGLCYSGLLSVYRLLAALRHQQDFDAAALRPRRPQQRKSPLECYGKGFCSIRQGQGQV